MNASWRGRTRVEIVDRWGEPAVGHVCKAAPSAPPAAAEAPPAGSPGAPVATPSPCEAAGAALRWSFETRHVELPDVYAALHVGTNEVDFVGAAKPGAIWNTTTEAGALVDTTDHIAVVDGASLHWGPPNDANIHWGVIFGAHVGMGRLDTTSTPLPSGNAYIGGMLGPTLGLIGTYSLVSGTSAMGGAMGMAGGIGVQWWPVNRFALHGGPALVLGFDPGFANAALRPGADVGASYAFVKVGRLAVDLALDITAATDRTFGLVGVGVNLN